MHLEVQGHFGTSFDTRGLGRFIGGITWSIFLKACCKYAANFNDRKEEGWNISMAHVRKTYPRTVNH